MTEAAQQHVRVRDSKHHLQRLRGHAWSVLRLVLPDGQILQNDALPEGPADLQMISYSSSQSSEDQIKLLISAADVNDIATAQQLLERSHDPNLGLGMETPLRQVGLLEASADPDILKNPGQGDLMFAATPRGIVEVVQLLLEASADPDMPNPRSRGHTPMFFSS